MPSLSSLPLLPTTSHQIRSPIAVDRRRSQRSFASGPMPTPFSITAVRDRCFRRAFLSAGLRPSAVALADGAVVHLWGPKCPDPARRRPLLLIHGFGAKATWQWAPHLRPLLRAGFDLYVPDLLFFGGSYATGPDRTESYQARCMMGAMEAVGVTGRFGLVGVSYGGFVGYRMAAMFPAAVDRVVLCCAGVCLDETDLAAGLFVVSDVVEAAEVLLPQTPAKLRQLVRYSFVRPPPVMPSCFLRDYIKVMCSDYVMEKTELINALVKDRKLSDLPKITQPTLIIWGEHDRIFPLELAHRLNRHLEGNSKLVVIKNAGHAVNLEKPKELCKHIKMFFSDSNGKDCNGSKGARWNLIFKFGDLCMGRRASRLPIAVKRKTWIRYLSMLRIKPSFSANYRSLPVRQEITVANETLHSVMNN